MLDIAADPDGGLLVRHESKWEIRRVEASPSILNMKRLTARLLLLVLFAGTLAPFAAASAPMQHEHCARKALAVRVESVPSCHHHAAAEATHEPVASGAVKSVHSNSCCTGHECCRSMVRSQWAQVGLRTVFQRYQRAADRVAFPQEQVRRLDLPAYHSVRAPPAL
jgi:hypothetical protein